jgi:hypothetical protein
MDVAGEAVRARLAAMNGSYMRDIRHVIVGRSSSTARHLEWPTACGRVIRSTCTMRAPSATPRFIVYEFATARSNGWYALDVELP